MQAKSIEAFILANANSLALSVASEVKLDSNNDASSLVNVSESLSSGLKSLK